MHRVVLADDEAYLLQELAQVPKWAEHHFEIIAAAPNGMVALGHVIEMRPDLLITDIRMPIMDGLTLIEKAKQVDPNLYCVILSGYEEFEYAVRALKLGVLDYLLKPFDYQKLYALLDRVHEKLDACARSGLEEALTARMEGFQLHQGSDNKYVEAVLAYVEENYTRDISLRSIAQHIFISENHLSRMFTRHYSIRFSEYLNLFRVTKAVGLLKDKDQTVFDVAEKVGYSNYNYFGAVFKKFTGLSPAQYRRLI